MFHIKNFGVSRQLVRKNHQIFYRGVGRDGRSSKLNDVEFSLIENEIRRLFAIEIYPSNDDIIKFINEKFKKYLYTEIIIIEN